MQLFCNTTKNQAFGSLPVFDILPIVKARSTTPLFDKQNTQKNKAPSFQEKARNYVCHF